MRDSAGLKTASAEAATWLSLVSYVRHTFTEYDQLLREQYTREAARFYVAGDIEKVLAGWGVRRRLAVGD